MITRLILILALVIRLILIIDSACTILSSSANNDSLTFSVRSLYLFIACSCRIALARISSTVFQEVVMVGILSHSQTRGERFNILPLNLMLSGVFSMGIQSVKSVPSLLEDFYLEWVFEAFQLLLLYLLSWLYAAALFYLRL